MFCRRFGGGRRGAASAAAYAGAAGLLCRSATARDAFRDVPGVVDTLVEILRMGASGSPTMFTAVAAGSTENAINATDVTSSGAAAENATVPTDCGVAVAADSASSATAAEGRAVSPSLVDSSCDGAGLASDACIGALRAIANLCYEHDASREAFLAAGGVDILARVLDVSPPRGPLAQFLCGAALNVAAECPALQTALATAGVCASLLVIAKAAVSAPSTRLLAVRALDSLCGTDAAVAWLTAGDATPLLVIVGLLLECMACGDDEASGIILAGVLTPLVRRPPVCAALLRCGALVTLARAVRDPSREPSARRRSIAIVVAAAIGEMDPAVFHGAAAPGEALATEILLWMAGDAGANICAAGAVAVGNMARSDDTALALARRPGVVHTLLGMAARGSDEDAYAALGVFKNLCVSREGRLALDGDVIPALLACAVRENPPVRFVALATLRLLTTTPGHATQLSRDLAGIAAVVRAAQGDTDSSDASKAVRGEDRVQLEASRVVANLAKYGGAPAALARISGTLSVVETLLGSKFANLRDEAATALTAIAAADAAVAADLAGREHVAAAIASALMPEEGVGGSARATTGALALLDAVTRHGAKLCSTPAANERVAAALAGFAGDGTEAVLAAALLQRIAVS